MILYIHGYNSTGEETAAKIRAGTGKEVIIISYPYTDAVASFESIKSQIEKYYSQDIILVGSSLGGFWANYFAERFNLRVVLINPAIHPSVSLKRYQPNTQEFAQYETEPSKGINRSIILGLCDEIISPEATIKRYATTRAQLYILPKEGHRFSDFTTINSIVNKVYNTYY
jgi:predicted esterase YcpF (UPF0227 family)